MDVLVPDIGDFKDVPVIALLVKPGDTVKPEDPLITLESEKATLDVPAPAAGVITEVVIKVGDKVSQGTLIARLEQKGGVAGEKPPEAPVAADRQGTRASEQVQPEKPYREQPPAAPPPPAAAPQPAAQPAAAIDEAGFLAAHASPAVRKLARELGVDLSKVTGSGPKKRILLEDVQAFVKAALGGGGPVAAGAGLNLAPWPKVDFAKFGPIETQPLTRIQKIAGPGLHRNWVTIPHVTNCDEADITGLEAFRVALNKEQDVKVTLLAFLVKACVATLQKFPHFNSALEGDHLVLRKYWNIGFAADTPQGLVVPVVKDADKKGVLAIARETSELAKKARDGKLQPGDMQGGTFSISSLGGIGGTYFTPIINAPEVAILGVCRAAMKPVWNGEEFTPRLMLPLSLSWDHRVVDGAGAARFNAHLASLLADARRMLL